MGRPEVHEATDAAPLAAAALSTLSNHGAAAEQVVAQLREGLRGRRATVVLLFFTAHHAPASGHIAAQVRTAIGPGALVGVSAESVLAGAQEVENGPGVSALALSLPGVHAEVFRTDQWPEFKEPPSSEDQLRVLARAAGMDRPDHRATFLFADPFSVPMITILPALARARPSVRNADGRGGPPAPILGGMASASSRPGGNRLILNDTVAASGGVGVSLSGAVRVDALVSQGCRPIGQPLVITAGKGQMISGLGGRPAMQVLSEIIESLDDRTKERLKKGLFVGRAVTEYKARFGRDDFLIRNVIGVEQSSGSVAVADLLRVGQTVQFHVRDEATASEDLALLLDAQQLRDDPFAGLLCTCNGRGSRLFSTPSHDAAMITRAFARPREADLFTPAAPGEDPTEPQPVARQFMPLAGFFAGGEIGPIGDGVFVHGQSAALALFRPPVT